MNVVITGASSGLGAALARRYANGSAVLGLIGPFFGFRFKCADRHAGQCGKENLFEIMRCQLCHCLAVP